MKCPRCGNEIANDSTSCAGCGENIETLSTAPQVDWKIVPNEIRGLNFSAFFLSWVWCFYHRSYVSGLVIFIISFFAYIHFGLIVTAPFIIYLLINGNRIAWKSRRYSNIEQFRKKQRILSLIGFPLFIIQLIIFPKIDPCIFLAMDKGHFIECSQALSALQNAEEKYYKDNKIYADNEHREYLGFYMIQGCSNRKGCGKQVEEHILPKLCKDFEIKLSNNGLDYKILGTALDRNSCKICVTRNGLLPAYMAECRNGIMKCP